MDSLWKPEPRKRAVVVGISYKSSDVTASYLPGCINDARAVRQILVDKYGFRSSDVELMTDEPGSKIMPTGSNIKVTLIRMIRRPQMGDVLLFHFSGHGTFITAGASPTQKEEDAIVPWDYNLITSVDFRWLTEGLPQRTNFVCIADASHSGGLIKNGTEDIGPNKDQYGGKKGKRMVQGRAFGYNDDDDDDHYYHVEITRPRMIPFEDLMDQVSTRTGNNIQSRAGNYSQNLACQMVDLYGDTASSLFRLPPKQIPQALEETTILLSACQKNEFAFECEVGGKSYGCFTHALLTRLREHRTGVLFYRQLVKDVRETLRKMGGLQHPCLYCSRLNCFHPFADRLTSLLKKLKTEEGCDQLDPITVLCVLCDL